MYFSSISEKIPIWDQTKSNVYQPISGAVHYTDNVACGVFLKRSWVLVFDFPSLFSLGLMHHKQGN